MTVIKRYELFLGGKPANGITGYVKYWNDSSPIALNGIEVTLEDTSENVIDTTTTDSDGFYSFDDVANGTYVLKITGQGAYSHGGVTNDDRDGVFDWGFNPVTIEKVRFLAGDCVISWSLNAADAGALTTAIDENDFSTLQNYPFVYFKTNETISANPGLAFSQPNVLIDNGSQTYDMYFLWAGDFDGSWTP